MKVGTSVIRYIPVIAPQTHNSMTQSFGDGGYWSAAPAAVLAQDILDERTQGQVQVVVGGKHVTRRQHLVPAREVAHIPAGLAHQEDAGGDIPGREPEFPVAVVAPRRDIGKVERGGAGTPDAGDLAHHRRQGCKIARMVAALAEGDTGADHGIAEVAPRRDAKAPVVEIGAHPLLRPEHLVARRLIDDAGDDLALALQGDRDAEMRDAVEEVERAVERIDKPAMLAVGADRLAALLHEEAEARARLLQLGADQFLGLEVGRGDEI